MEETIQIRFRFQSDGDIVWPGSYIDDVHFYGRKSVPEAPEKLEAKAESWDQIKLQWKDKSKSEDGFKVERREAKKEDWKQITVTEANVKTYLDKGLKEKTRYEYRVQAFNSMGNSCYSNIAKAQTKKLLVRKASRHGGGTTLSMITDHQHRQLWQSARSGQ